MEALFGNLPTAAFQTIVEKVRQLIIIFLISFWIELSLIIYLLLSGLFKGF